ncbi:MAG: hypothetical protein IPJ34_32335 [Myxococcales bacterium]|nr:hypothetical protein [Myxococcales bacterium]
MKTTETCPKCECRRLFVIEQVTQAVHDARNVVPMNVTTLAMASAYAGVADDNQTRAGIGSFEAWVCSKCGYTEWYARDAVTALDWYVARKGPGVRVVDREGEPYR